MWGGNHRLGMWAAGMLGLAGMAPVSAGLPGLDDKEWLGYFVGFQNRKFQFAISAQGKATIKVIGEKGPLAQRLTIPVEFLVEEIRPDGKTTVKNIKPETLESAQPATRKPQQLVIHGKVTGDAGFEVFINEDRGAISLGGRLLAPGTLTKNPLRFSIRLKFPDAYPNIGNAAGDKKEVKELKEKTRNDRLQLSWTDGTRVRQPADKAVDVGSKEINGPGIAAMQVEFSSYDQRKFEFAALGNSAISLSGTRAAPLYEGFTLTWVADPAKDPEGKARLSIEVK